MPDVTKLPASRLEALYAERRAGLVAVSDELIAAGLGMVSGEEIVKLAANEDPLAVRYVEAQEAFLEVAYEKSARLHEQSPAKSVRSRAVSFYGAIRRSLEDERAPRVEPVAQSVPLRAG